MDHMQILKRAWRILWSYRTLWVFGVILALTSPSGSSNLSFNRPSAPDAGRDFNFTPPDEVRRELEKLGQLFSQGIPVETQQALIRIAVLLVLAFLLMAILFAIGYYVSQTALIRMVDRYERDEQKLTWKDGLRLGWSRVAWRLFLIDLVIFLPLVVAFLLLFGCAALPVLLSVMAGQEPTMAGIIATVGLAFLIIFMAIIVGFVLSLILEIIKRACVLGDYGVRTSIRQGWSMVRSHLKDVFLMWLILLGIKIGFVIAVIPVVLLLFGVGLLVGGGIGVVLYLIVQAAASVTAGWVTAAIVGGTLFILVLALPLLFFGGLRDTYISSAWTLAYSELRLPVPRSSDLPDEGQVAQPA
jgi:hypothetical protein